MAVSSQPARPRAQAPHVRAGGQPMPIANRRLLVTTAVLTVCCVLQGCLPALLCLGPGLIAAIVVS